MTFTINSKALLSKIYDAKIVLFKKRIILGAFVTNFNNSCNFEGGIYVLIAPVAGHCFLVSFIMF